MPRFPTALKWIAIEDRTRRPFLAVEQLNGDVRTLDLEEADDKIFKHLNTGVRVAAALEPRQTIEAILGAPTLSTRKTERVIPTLLERSLPFALEEASVSFHQKRSNDPGGGTILCAAARKRDIAQRLKALHARRIDAESLFPAGAAIFEYLASIGTLPAAPAAILYANDASGLLLLTEKAQLLAVHPCRPDDPKALLRMIASQFPEPALVQWAVTGPADHGDALTKAIMDPNRTREIKLAKSERLLPMALLYAARNSPELNLRCGPLSHPVVTKRKARAQLKRAAVIAACSILIAAVAVTTLVSRIGQIQRSTQRAHHITKRLAGYQINVRGESAIAVAKQEWKKRIDPNLSAFMRAPLAGQAAAAILLATDNQISLHALRVGANSFDIDCSGTPGALKSFEKALEQKTAHLQAIHARHGESTNRVNFEGAWRVE